MRLLITIALMGLSFIFGVMYDQNMAVLPLQKEVRAERERNTLLKTALDVCTKNKFKSRDYIWDQVQKLNKEN